GGGWATVARTMATRSRHEGFLEEGVAREGDAVAHDLVVGVAAHVEDLELGPARLEEVGELAAAHAGHDDVGDEEVDRAQVGALAGFGLLAAARAEDDVAVDLEGALDEAAHAILVLGEED